MDVQIVISARAKVALALIEEKYPDLEFDDERDGYETYYVGDSSDEVWCRAKEETGNDRPMDEEMEAVEYFSRDEAVECCGFCEALGASTLLGGNGPWAQGELRKEDAYKKGAKAARKARGTKKEDPATA